MSNPDLYVYGHKLHKNIPTYIDHIHKIFYCMSYNTLGTHFLKMYLTSNFNKLSLIF